MSSKETTGKIHECTHIILTEAEWRLPLLASSSTFYLTADAPTTHVICDLKKEEAAAIFIEIIDQNVSELKLEVTLDDRASLELVCLLKGPRSCKLNIKIELIGEHSVANIRNIILSSEEDKNMLQTIQGHDGRYSHSSVRNIAILDDRSSLSFGGLIKINPQAYNTESSQYTHAVLLSKSAHADVSPNLEIANKEVTCNHGASIGQLDQMEMYYMQSRGLNTIIAQNLLIKGCILSAFDGLNNPFWKDVSDNISNNEQFFLQQTSKTD